MLSSHWELARKVLAVLLASGHSSQATSEDIDD